MNTQELFGNLTKENQVIELGNLALVAGAFDEFGLEDVINQKIGKEGSHVNKALTMQMLNVPIKHYMVQQNILITCL